MIETVVVAAADGRAPVCVGISAPTAELAAVYARDAESAGADGAMVLPPLFYRADERELVEFFGSVARATELPLMSTRAAGPSSCAGASGVSEGGYRARVGRRSP